MPINIKGVSGTPPQNTVNKANRNSKGGKSQTSGASSATGDSVELTDTATELKKIEQSLASLPIVDQARVQSVSQSIEQGDYHIDEEKIADVIIKSEKTSIR